MHRHTDRLEDKQTANKQIWKQASWANQYGWLALVLFYKLLVLLLFSTGHDQDLLYCVDFKLNCYILILYVLVDVWQNWHQPSETEVCIHTEEPYLKNLLYDNTISTPDYLSSPLVDLADHL